MNNILEPLAMQQKHVIYRKRQNGACPIHHTIINCLYLLLHMYFLLFVTVDVPITHEPK